MNREFKKEDLVELAAGGEVGHLIVMTDSLTGHDRWSLHYRLVFKDMETGKFYQTTYSKGATEQQDESPFQDEDALIDCEEVQPVQKTFTVYEPV